MTNAEEPQEPAQPQALTCVNCDRPATWREKDGQGYQPDYFCDEHADAAHPDREALEAVE